MIPATAEALGGHNTGACGPSHAEATTLLHWMVPNTKCVATGGLSCRRLHSFLRAARTGRVSRLVRIAQLSFWKRTPAKYASSGRFNSQTELIFTLDFE